MCGLVGPFCVTDKDFKEHEGLFRNLKKRGAQSAHRLNAKRDTLGGATEKTQRLGDFLQR
jgi:hypothetical protein